MKLSNKNIILTGASSGIGKEILNILAKFQGVKIIAVARNIESIACIQGIVYPFSADVSSKEGVDHLFEYAKGIFNTIDLFIANAGFAYLEKINEPDWQHIENIYNLNVFSPIFSLEKLVEQSKGRETAFACTISGVGFVSLPAYSLYCSTKAALHHFIQTYRYEKPNNLQLTAIYPVATRTPFFDKATGESETPLPFPVQEASVVAQKIVRGIESGKKKIYPSILFRIFLFISAIFPFNYKIYSLMEKRKVNKWLNL